MPCPRRPPVPCAIVGAGLHAPRAFCACRGGSPCPPAPSAHVGAQRAAPKTRCSASRARKSSVTRRESFEGRRASPEQRSRVARHWQEPHVWQCLLMIPNYGWSTSCGVWGLSMTNSQVPSACLRTTSVLTPRVTSSAPFPVAGSTTQPPCSTARPCRDSTTARVSSFIRPQRRRMFSNAFLISSRPDTILASTTRIALGS